MATGIQLDRRKVLTGGAAVVAGVAAGYGSRLFGVPPIVAPIEARHRVHGDPSRSILSGVAVRPDQIAPSAGARRALLDRFDLMIPEYHAQWSAIEFEPGRRWFGNFDQIAAYARSRRITVRGHALIWEQMTPEWIRAALAAPGGWSHVDAHFTAMLTRHADIVDEWIVVNEMIDTENGQDGLRRTSFQRAFGNAYVERALRRARAIAPDTRLMINEYGLEYGNSTDSTRRSALLRLVGRLKAADVPLDAVGLQAHLDLSKGRLATKEIAKFCTELAAMDVDIAVTELDVLEQDRGGSIAARDGRVADEVREYLDVLLDQLRVRSVATWGLSDRDSWLQDRSEATRSAASCAPVDCVNLNRGLPYDGALATKAMALSVDEAIRSAVMREV